ncbi:protein Lines homolog 1 isoform X2 [Myripristis murdjan]|uniref:protein Lines homolog 1 isoform X2 n=1 Tax=Myripristis murdjan TaxID=586833 RepID=UPI0011761142|nr:protein Lines homolog 1 isoform X2 [Myripristis murdjan]
MTNHFDSVCAAYRCLLRGSCPSQSPGDLAAAVVPGLCGVVPVRDRHSDCPCQSKGSSDSQSCSVTSSELSCVTLTLLDKISSSLMSQSMPPEVSSYLMEVHRVLNQEMHVMAKLVHQFRAEDQLISHLAAKTVSTYIVCELQMSGTLNPVWQQTCVQVFHKPSPCNELEACMWSLTDVLKKLLKGCHEEILGRLLAAFDPSLSALYSTFLPQESTELRQCEVDFTNTGHWETTACALLDLLEVLTASRLTCPAGVSLQSQRLTVIHASALLRMADSSLKYFVKKRVLLLLKNTLLHKAGEDAASGAPSASGPTDKLLSADMMALADSVLQALSANWLQRVEVEAAASFFGGSSRARGDGGQKPDYVMLRAVSLLVLKAMELKILSAGGAGVGCAVEVHGYLLALSGFLRQRGVPLKEASHRCCWFSLLFGEQDDDMMEAAKALLSMFQHHRRSSGLHGVAAAEAACASGGNPHCHFLLLLHNISFDHSILLDFLISSETCFLEYFVRYLKHLRADWAGFTFACQRIEVSDRHHALTALCDGDAAPLSDKHETGTWFGQDQVQSNLSVQPTALTPAGDDCSLTRGLRLVDYGSSEESDIEDMDVSEDSQETGRGNMGPGLSVSEEGRLSGLAVKQATSGLPVFTAQAECKPSDSTARAQTEPSSALERGTRGLYPLASQSGQTSCPNTTPLSRRMPHPGSETCTRAVLCLSELREVVMRLQMKKLFPYNPLSLLKLLAQIETLNCSHNPSEGNK